MILESEGLGWAPTEGSGIDGASWTRYPKVAEDVLRKTPPCWDCHQERKRDWFWDFQRLQTVHMMDNWMVGIQKVVRDLGHPQREE